MERKAKVASLSGLFLLVIVGVMVMVNIVSYGFNKRLDMTKNERYTLSKGSARLVNELKENIDVTLYVTRGLPKTDLFVEDLINLINEYEEAGAGKFRYHVVEAKTEEEKKAAKKAGLQEAAFGEGSETGDNVNITKGYMGVVFEYGSEKEVIPILSPDQSQGLEFWISNKIREIRDRAEDQYQMVGVIIKDGIKLTDANLVPPQGRGGGPNIKGLLQRAFPFYKIEDVDLQDGEAEIDSKLSGVIMLQADKDWSDKELARVDQFLMLGNKSLVVVAGAVNMKPADPKMTAELSTRGIDKLLGGYGVELRNDAVLDWGTQMRLPVQNQMGQLQWLTFPGISQVQHDDGAEPEEQTLDNSFAAFFRMEEMAFPYASSLLVHPEKQPAAEFKVVARTSPNATVMTGDRVDLRPNLEMRPEGEFARYDIAATLEGKLKSVYADKAPEGFTFKNKEAPEVSRILVIASPQYLSNPLARAGNPPPMPPQMQMMGPMGGDPDLQRFAVPYAQRYLTTTILAFKNMLDWMSGDRDLIAVSAKLTSEPNVSYKDVAEAEFDINDSDEDRKRKQEEYVQGRRDLQVRVKWTLTLLPALFFMVFGIARWQWREANRGRVKLD